MEKDIVITSSNYENNKSPLNCSCLVCDNEFTKSWNQLSKGQFCPSCKVNKDKVSKEYINKLVSSKGFEIVEFIKNDSKRGTVFTVKCPKNHEHETTYRDFINRLSKNSTTCDICRPYRIYEVNKNDPNEVLNNIKQWGYTVESGFEYINSSKVHTFTCQYGHDRKISYHSLERTPRCPECNGSPHKHTDEDIQNILKEFGLTYIGGYDGAGTKFKFICNCGEPTENTLKAIRKGIRCRKCNQHKRFTFDDVKEMFENEGYTLLETEYNNSKQQLKFICPKGHENSIILNTFLKGVRCRDCHFESIKGENSPHWNPELTDKERYERRKYPEYKEWRTKVYERDNYTCQCCGDNKGHNLVAHHLNSHDWAKSERTDVDNGLTLCDVCHTDYHNIYGYGDNTKEQFDEYLEELYSDNLSTPS